MATANPAIPQPSMQGSLLDRLAGVFTTVKPGEGATSLLMALNLFVLLGTYYLLKTVREALILSEGPSELKSYAAAGQAILLLGIVPLYGWLSTKLQRVKLVVAVTIFFALNLLGFSAAIAAGVKVGLAFFLWIGIFNLFIVSQFWSLVNDALKEEEGKRLFPLIGLGSSIGAWVGSLGAKSLFQMTGIQEILLLGALLLGGSLGITWLINRRVCFSCGHQDVIQGEPLTKQGGFQLVLSDRYLLLMAALIFVLNVVNSLGEFMLGSFVVEQAKAAGGDAKAFIGSFYAGYFSWVNLIGLLLQLFGVSLLFRSVGVRGALFVLPCIALLGYASLLFFPLLGVVRIIKIAENATDYSVQSTTRQALFLPTSREAKYKAKAAIDTFVVRTADMLQGGIVWLGVNMLSLSIANYALLNLALVLVWLVLAWRLSQRYHQISVTE
jgi:ATP:ADP antiporter, AAA family